MIERRMWEGPAPSKWGGEGGCRASAEAPGPQDLCGGELRHCAVQPWVRVHPRAKAAGGRDGGFLGSGVIISGEKKVDVI